MGKNSDENDSLESAETASFSGRVRRLGKFGEKPLVEAGKVELGEQMIQVDLFSLSA